MNPALIAASAAAAAAAARQSKVLKALEQAQAFDAQSALSVERLPDDIGDALTALCKDGPVMRTSDGRVYLDRVQQRRQRERQAQVGRVVVIAILAIGTAFAGFLIFVAAR